MNLGYTKLNVPEAEGDAIYGAATRIWLLPQVVEFKLSHTSIHDEDADSVTTAGLAGWVGDHHSFGVSYSDQGDLDTTSFLYPFNW